MIETTSNFSDLESRLASRFGTLETEYTVSIENRQAYAAAVDQGWERTIIWADLPVKQRIAIIMAMKAKDGQARVWDGNEGFIVTRGEGWVKIVVPPAGIMAKSYDPIREHSAEQLGRLPAGFTPAELKMALIDCAQGAQSILVDNTPVREGGGGLAGAWEVVVR